MSLGEGAKAYIVLQDDQTVMYMYGCFSCYYDKNWGEPVDCDGLITIQKECFQEPEIHQKLKRMPSGRKRLVTKKIPVDVDYPTMIDKGLITIENSKYAWHIYSDGVDAMAYEVIYKILYEYQIEGVIPELIGIYM